MKPKNRPSSGRVIILAIFGALLLTQSWFPAGSLGRDSGAKASPALQNTLFLPPILSGYPIPPPTFGTQVKPWHVNQVMGQLANSNAYWVRFNGFDWNKVESIRTDPPTYRWGYVRETALQNIASDGMKIIGVVSFVPPWAQKEPPHSCGPIKAEAFAAFAQFLQALVQRYGKYPYNIKYWELGNEPDIDPDLVSQDSPYGCWGDSNDSYYGGGYYAEMLKVAYPAIKSVDPKAKVLMGGVLLDCDPTHPPAGKDCLPAKFLEGILVNGAGGSFDIVSFHGYPNYSGDVGGGLADDENHAAWGHRGGVVLGKISFLREVMANYGLNKPIMHTEGSLICISCSQASPAFLEAQADYVAWLFVRNLAQGIKATTWYEFDGPGWQLGGLLDENQNPRPAYHALTFLTQELNNAAFKRVVNDYPALRAYEFRSPEKRIWVLWSPDGVEHSISLPPNVQKIYDKYGTEIPFAGNQVAVKSPIYVEIVP